MAGVVIQDTTNQEALVLQTALCLTAQASVQNQLTVVIQPVRAQTATALRQLIPGGLVIPVTPNQETVVRKIAPCRLAAIKSAQNRLTVITPHSLVRTVPAPRQLIPDGPAFPVMFSQAAAVFRNLLNQSHLLVLYLRAVIKLPLNLQIVPTQ